MRLILFLFLVFAITVFSNCRKEVGEKEVQIESQGKVVSKKPKDVEKNSMNLIEDAYRAGKIDYQTSLLFKVYAIFEVDSLPERYRSSVPIKDGTPYILEVQRNWDHLGSETRELISHYVQPVRPHPGANR